MRITAFITFLFFIIPGFAQKADSLSIDTAQISAVHKRINEDIKEYTDSINKEMINRQTQQSIDYFVRMQNERKAKQKKQAIIRIAIGAGFLVILIIGLLRRRKLKK